MQYELGRTKYSYVANSRASKSINVLLETNVCNLWAEIFICASQFSKIYHKVSVNVVPFLIITTAKALMISVA